MEYELSAREHQAVNNETIIYILPTEGNDTPDCDISAAWPCEVAKFLAFLLDVFGRWFNTSFHFDVEFDKPFLC